jgi:hypothetical protein
MDTSFIKPDGRLRIFNALLSLGLVMLLLAPVSPAAAQAGLPPAPLFSQLAWIGEGSTERAFEVNGELVTLTGTSYRVEGSFDVESSDEVTTYYSTTSLGQAGWQEVSTTPLPNGVSSIYFHPAGVYAVVEFFGCDDGGTCLTVWQSDPTDLGPSVNDRFQPQAVGTLTKSSPANGATNVDTSVTLSWNAYTGTDLNRYRYCIDTTNNSECDSSGGWTAVWSGRSVNITGLQPNTRYYWQVQAVLNDETKVDANGGTWWSFTTKGSTNIPPGAFSKTLPADGATGQSITPTLVWQASQNATAYEYCVDTVDNDVCDSNWVSTTNTFVTLMTGVGANITYYWQVRATNPVGVVYANNNAWASFSTAEGPGNDSVDSAAEVQDVPYESNINTTAATLDTGTANSCSPSLGLASVWYKYTPNDNRRIYFDTFGSSYNTFIAVWTKNANGTLSLVTCNDDAPGTQQSNINMTVNNGTTYYIQVAQRNAGAATVATPGGDLKFHVRNFADVAGSSIYWKYIEGIYKAGITGGCAAAPNLLYCPSTIVDRASMAVFLLRGMHKNEPNWAPPDAGSDTGFADVPPNYWAAAWIEQLAVEGVTAGCGSGNYCPANPVTRAEMAVFLLRAKYGSGYTPPAVGSDTGFADVPTTHWAAAWIKALAAEGITSGCSTNPNRYCPDNGVTRDQMAVFLSRTFNIPQVP